MYNEIKENIKEYLKERHIECDESIIKDNMIEVVEYNQDDDNNFYTINISYTRRDDIEQSIIFNTVRYFPMWGNPLDLSIIVERDTNHIVKAWISNCNDEGLYILLDASKLPLHLTKSQTIKDFYGNDILEITTDNLFNILKKV